MSESNYLQFFVPSVLRLPAEALSQLGSSGALVARAALCRVWQVGETTYQPVAVCVPVPGGAAADLLVRRRYTLEVGRVVASGSLADGLECALGWLEAFRRSRVEQVLLAEYAERGINAGLPAARELRQAFVLAPQGLYQGASNEEVERLRNIWTVKKEGPFGFRFLTFEDAGDEIRVLAAPEPFGQELSDIRNVSGSMKAA